MSKTILVTGSSSGIGLSTVRLLLKKNHRVVAIVRDMNSIQKLQSELNEFVGTNQLICLELDLSNLKKIDQLPFILKDSHQIYHLDGLVNNAGIALAGPFLDQPFDEVQTMMQVNVLAVMKITQVLLPLLKSIRSNETPSAYLAGRIVNISSISGKSAAPFLSVYAASKHAIEGFSVGLRKELTKLGIKVIVIGPGSIKTPIWDKGFAKLRNHYEKSIYRDPFDEFIKFAMTEKDKGLPVETVSELILHVLTTDHPKKRYAPIPRKWLNWYLPLLIPDCIYDYLTTKALKLRF